MREVAEMIVIQLQNKTKVTLDHLKAIILAEQFQILEQTKDQKILRGNLAKKRNQRRREEKTSM